MGEQSDWISVTCGCGRNVRFRRSLARQGTRCPACGATVMAPLEMAPAGPPCPHCGLPWPATEKRCPSCLARHRYVGKVPPEFYQVEPQEPEPETISATAVGGTSDKQSPRPYYAEPPSDIPANARVEQWHQQPCEHGWRIAAAALGLLALTSLLAASGSPCSAAWLIAGGLLLVLGYGLLRGNGAARGFTVALPLLVLTAEMALLLGYASSQAGSGELTVLAVTLGLLCFGLGLLTVHHGRNDTILAGAAMTGVGLLALLLSPGLLSANHPAWPTITAALQSEVSRMVPKDNPAAAQEPPGPNEPPDGQVANGLGNAEPAYMPTPVQEPQGSGQDIAAAEPAASAPASQPTPESTQPTAEAAAGSAQPAEPIANWQGALAARGITLQFPDVVSMKATRTRQTFGERTIPAEIYAVDTPALHCGAILYAGLAATSSAPASQPASPLPEELRDVAREVAAQVGLPMENEMWRTGMNPLVYYIRLTGQRDGETWQVRIESRAIGSEVLVMVSQHRPRDAAARNAAWNFFKSLTVRTPRR